MVQNANSQSMLTPLIDTIGYCEQGLVTSCSVVLTNFVKLII